MFIYMASALGFQTQYNIPDDSHLHIIISLTTLTGIPNSIIMLYNISILSFSEVYKQRMWCPVGPDISPISDECRISVLKLTYVAEIHISDSQ